MDDYAVLSDARKVRARMSLRRLGNCPGKLSELDRESKISRDVTDEEILEFARAKAGPDDPDGAYMLRRFRAN